MISINSKKLITIDIKACVVVEESVDPETMSWSELVGSPNSQVLNYNFNEELFPAETPNEVIFETIKKRQ